MKKHSEKCASHEVDYCTDNTNVHLMQKDCDCDGYHTFDELYDHRIMLWIALCKAFNSDPQYITGLKSDIWRSKLHSDGSCFDGWFVLGMGRNLGKQITYHIPIERWDECDFAETREKAPEFDGHTSDDVLERLKSL